MEITRSEEKLESAFLKAIIAMPTATSWDLVLHLRSLDLCVLKAKIQFVWFDHFLIATFIRPKPKLGILQPWLEPLNSETKQGRVSFNHEVGSHILLSQV